MTNEKKPLKILHTSDIHLGAYDKRSGRFSDENKVKQEVVSLCTKFPIYKDISFQ